MPEKVTAIIDHRQTPEVQGRPGYRKCDIGGHEQGTTSTFNLNTAEPGTGAPLHTNTIDKFIVIDGGKVEVKIDGATHVVDKNHTLVISPGAEHGFKVVGEETTKLLVFFPELDLYSTEHTNNLEFARPT